MAARIEKPKKGINAYILVILSFVIIILIGSLLLTMPFSNTNNEWIPYIDALVTAVSATCVTGVATYEAGFACSVTIYGQIITAILIQIGGLGFITFLTFFITLFAKKLQFKNRYVISQMVNSTNVADVVSFVRKLIIISLICETMGFLLGLPVFLIMYPDNVGQALWNCLFHSISGFNNAGFDLFNGTTSLIGCLEGVNGETTPMWAYYYFCSYEMVLIILGGISFLVIAEIFLSGKKPRQWRVFTKIVLSTTFILLVVGALLFFLTDGLKAENPMTWFDCLFESVTCRTAGFMTYSQDQMSTAGKIVGCFLMIVGGSPVSTAGGIKTTTIFLVFLSIYSYLSGRQLVAFKRKYSTNMVVKAMSLIFLTIFILILAFIGLSTFGLDPKYEFSSLGLHSDLPSLYVYEIFSCFGTVGFFTGIEPYLSLGSKIILCIIMFLGRLGPFTFFQIFQSNMDKKVDKNYEYIEEDFIIG